MKLSNKLFKMGLLACAIAALPVYAQDEVRINFKQDGVDKDKKYHRIAVDLKYKSECADLEKACAKFFFNDSVSTTLEAAVKNYQSLFSTSKTFKSVADFVHISALTR